MTNIPQNFFQQQPQYQQPNWAMMNPAQQLQALNSFNARNTNLLGATPQQQLQAGFNLAGYQQAQRAVRPALGIGGILANQVFPQMLNNAPELASVGTQASLAKRETAGYDPRSSSALTRQQAINERAAAAAADAQYRARQQALAYYPQFAGAQAGLAQATPTVNIDPNANLGRTPVGNALTQAVLASLNMNRGY